MYVLRPPYSRQLFADFGPRQRNRFHELAARNLSTQMYDDFWCRKASAINCVRDPVTQPTCRVRALRNCRNHMHATELALPFRSPRACTHQSIVLGHVAVRAGLLPPLDIGRDSVASKADGASGVSIRVVVQQRPRPSSPVISRIEGRPFLVEIRNTIRSLNVRVKAEIVGARAMVSVAGACDKTRVQLLASVRTHGRAAHI
jgi:hypothetical protein